MVKDGKERGLRPEQTLQMINFTVGGDEYAVEIQKVREVINFREITQLPKAPSFVKGIINLRGEMIPVIDLREKFGLTHEAYSALTNLVIVEIGRKAVGVVVDERAPRDPGGAQATWPLRRRSSAGFPAGT